MMMRVFPLWKTTLPYYCLRLLLLFILIISIRNVGGGWIDPDTNNDESIQFTNSLVDNTKYSLVFSDEFSVEGRTFHDGQDSRWTSIHKDDYTNFALQFYNSDLVHTSSGYLNISTIVKDTSFHFESGPKKSTKTKNYQSGMIQGWNKFCFTGGIVEISAKLPGKYDIGGFWPAVWLLGNLARATYVGSSNNIWPWSYDTCRYDIIKEQAISSCNVVNHYGLHSKQGRGAPEIDILEAMPGVDKLLNTPIKRPYFSTSYQVAPGYADFRPNVGEVPPEELWYSHDIEYAEGNETALNIFFYGMHLSGQTPDMSYLADAISANTNLYETHFEDFHKYRLEWIPGPDGYIKWFLDDKFFYGINANALNLTGAIIPEEPMYLILNTAISSTWGFPQPCPEGCACDCFDARKTECSCGIPDRMIENFPAEFLIDYVRVYQAEDDINQIVGCSTASHPSRKYIEGHKDRYMEKGQNQPLKELERGGAICHDNAICTHGNCIKNKCVCNDGYSGSTCKASLGFDDIIWDKDEDFPISFLFVPAIFIWLVLGIAILTILVIIYKYNDNIRIRRNYIYSSLDNESFDLGLELGSMVKGNKNDITNDRETKKVTIGKNSVGLPFSYQREVKN